MIDFIILHNIYKVKTESECNKMHYKMHNIYTHILKIKMKLKWNEIKLKLNDKCHHKFKNIYVII